MIYPGMRVRFNSQGSRIEPQHKETVFSIRNVDPYHSICELEPGLEARFEHLCPVDEPELSLEELV